ncbi:MAG: tRNA-dihydrouridine synthase family protein [Planctomycetes bacterium]|nr:tRNA-dihydrouridine synthase family protein [Planctomycetota bacterium]
MTPLPLPFTAPWLLAPMEGVTEPCFRDLVLERNPAAALGGAYTEFVRVVDLPLPRRVLREHLGPRRFETPVGIQLMGADIGALAETARRAVEVGSPLVDLNFGCPAKGALRGCAGSALLKEPAKLEAIVRACVAVVTTVPVTAKIRAGFDDAVLLEDLAHAAAAGGASLLTVHCRTRAEGYQELVDWSRIARAVAAVAIPVCGNGGVDTHADLERMRRETGCDYVMVGRAALGDPWIFQGARVSSAEAALFLVDYARALMESGNAREKGAAARVKQLLRHWTAGALFDHDRARWLGEPEPRALLAHLARAAGVESAWDSVVETTERAAGG